MYVSKEVQNELAKYLQVLLMFETLQSKCLIDFTVYLLNLLQVIIQNTHKFKERQFYK